MVTILERRFNNLQKDLDILNIHQYFNINNATIQLLDLNTLEIGFETFVNDNIIELMRTLKFIKPSRFNKLSITTIPTEIQNLIISYIPHHLFLKVNMHVEYPIQYPFRQPIWSLNYINTNIKHTDIVLEDYYKMIIKNHTESYNIDWSPAIQLYMDYISIYMKIDHFDELIQNYLF